MPWTTRQAVELFHLLFLAELGDKLDRRIYAVKGGCNLRFFFGSPRYSEDLDLDLDKLAVGTLRNKVDRLLQGRSLALSLAAHTLEITAISRPKQTETTQRWKIGLSSAGQALHTKVEFSRRGLGTDVYVEPVDRALAGNYRLRPMLLSHYGRQQAFEQKVGALVGRSETQARDVFDLDILLSGSDQVHVEGLSRGLRLRACERALAVDYDTFRAQVLVFLPVEQQALYDDRASWEHLVLRVVDRIGDG